MSHKGGIGVGGERRRAGGTNLCRCPKCGYTTTHERGKPCSSIKCPRCGTPLAGAW